MPKAKSSVSKASPPPSKKAGTGRKKSSVKKEDNGDEEVHCVSDNEDSMEAVDVEAETGDLPVVPSSGRAVKKVLVIPKGIRWENILEFHWKHPRTGGKSLFLLNTSANVDQGKTTLATLTFEVLTMQQDTRSWFVENTIISDGNFYVCSPVDPLFFIIPSLSKCEKAKPITDHLYESSLPRALVDVFSKRLSHTQLSNVAIKKEFDDLVVFAYSEEKTLTWLSKKVEKVAKFLAQKEISQAESSVSSNFVKSSTDGICKDDCLRYASDIVGEYIEDDLKKKMLEKLGLPVISEKSGIKRKNVLGSEDENTSKKSKLADGDAVPLEDYGSSNPNTPVNKNTKVTAKEKEFQKAAQGSHSLFKFFAPKAK